MPLGAVQPRLDFRNPRLPWMVDRCGGGQLRGVGIAHPLAPRCSGSLPSSPDPCDGGRDWQTAGPLVLPPGPSQGWRASDPHFPGEEVQPQRAGAGSSGLWGRDPALGCLLPAAGLQPDGGLRARTLPSTGARRPTDSGGTPWSSVSPQSGVNGCSPQNRSPAATRDGPPVSQTHAHLGPNPRTLLPSEGWAGAPLRDLRQRGARPLPGLPSPSGTQWPQRPPPPRPD